MADWVRVPHARGGKFEGPPKKAHISKSRDREPAVGDSIYSWSNKDRSEAMKSSCVLGPPLKFLVFRMNAQSMPI